MSVIYSSATSESIRRHRVVLVDDDETVRAVLGFSLRRFGFDVEGFGCGREALDYLQRDTCRFVLTDLHMPDVDGLQLARWLGTHRPGIGVALITGDEDRARQLLAHAGLPADFPVLCKPFTVERLDDLVRHLLATHELAEHA
jgi:DNA-binding NtrC family response regulator